MFTHGYAGDPFLCNISPTKIMFWCKKWLEYLDKSMKSNIFAPKNIFTALRQQILDTLWKWEKHGKRTVSTLDGGHQAAGYNQNQ